MNDAARWEGENPQHTIPFNGLSFLFLVIQTTLDKWSHGERGRRFTAACDQKIIFPLLRFLSLAWEEEGKILHRRLRVSQSFSETKEWERKRYHDGQILLVMGYQSLSVWVVGYFYFKHLVLLTLKTFKYAPWYLVLECALSSIQLL